MNLWSEIEKLAPMHRLAIAGRILRTTSLSRKDWRRVLGVSDQKLYRKENP